MEPHKHCHFCGEPYDFDVRRYRDWPRVCGACGEATWKNPAPVVVMLVPVGQTRSGLLTVRRNHDPKKGLLALPSGYVDSGETWKAAAVRELKEETGIVRKEQEVRLYDVISALNTNAVLIFCRLPPIDKLPSFEPNVEVAELVTITEPVELAFPTHTEVVRRGWGLT